MRPLRVSASLCLDHPVSCQLSALGCYQVSSLMNLTTINFLLSKIDCVLTLVRGPHYATNPYYGKCWEPASVRNDGRPRSSCSPIICVVDITARNMEHWNTGCSTALRLKTHTQKVYGSILIYLNSLFRRGFSGSVAELKIHH